MGEGIQEIPLIHVIDNLSMLLILHDIYERASQTLHLITVQLTQSKISSNGFDFRMIKDSLPVQKDWESHLVVLIPT